MKEYSVDVCVEEVKEGYYIDLIVCVCIYSDVCMYVCVYVCVCVFFKASQHGYLWDVICLFTCFSNEK